MGFYAQVILPFLCDFGLDRPFVARYRRELLAHFAGATRRRNLRCFQSVCGGRGFTRGVCRQGRCGGGRRGVRFCQPRGLFGTGGGAW